MSTQEKKATKNNYKIIIIILSIIIIGLAGWVYHLHTTLSTVVVEKEEVIFENTDLTFELDSLLVEHDSIKAQYGELNDSLLTKDSLIRENAKEIRRLIASQADYRRIKKKLNFLRDIQQGYVQQLDSLFVVNKELVDENTKIKVAYYKAKKQAKGLSKEKDQLSAQVKSGSIMQAYQITATPLRVRGGNKDIVTDKGKRAHKVKICFTIAKNLIVKQGPLDVYARISAPNGEILTQGEGDEFAFANNAGDTLQYSLKETIDYKNIAKKTCIEWHRTKEFEPGKYDLTIHAGGHNIGGSFFELK